MVAESPRAQILKHITWTHSLSQDFALSQNHTHKQTGTNVKEAASIRRHDRKWLYRYLEFGRNPTAVVPTTSQVRPMQASNILPRVKYYNIGLKWDKRSYIQTQRGLISNQSEPKFPLMSSTDLPEKLFLHIPLFNHLLFLDLKTHMQSVVV